MEPVKNCGCLGTMVEGAAAQAANPFGETVLIRYEGDCEPHAVIGLVTNYNYQWRICGDEFNVYLVDQQAQPDLLVLVGVPA